MSDLRAISSFFLNAGVLSLAEPFLQKCISSKVQENKTSTESDNDEKFLYSICLLSTSRIREAIELLNCLLNYSPSSYYLSAYLGISLCLNGELEIALEYMKKSIELNSQLYRIQALYNSIQEILQISLSSHEMRILRHEKTMILFNQLKSSLAHSNSFYLEAKSRNLHNSEKNEILNDSSIYAKSKKKYALDFLQGVDIYVHDDTPFPLK